MAAYAALVSLAQTIDQMLNDDRYSVSPHVKQQMISVHEYVILLQAFLEDFPDKANSLEGQIRDVATEAEDIIECFIWKYVQPRYRLIKSTEKPPISKSNQGGEYTHDHDDFHVLIKVLKTLGLNAADATGLFKNRFSNDFLQLSDLSAACSSSRLAPTSGNDMVMGFDESEKVTEKIASIAEQEMNTKNNFKIKDEQQLGDPPAVNSSSSLAPTGKNIMVGFDDDLMTIKARLCGESSKLQVISIFGMAGIDKTTLTRNSYDDPLIMEHFDICSWVTISQDYSAEKIFSDLLESMKGFTSKGFGRSNEEKVYRTLKGRRYLIVMDDLWSTKAWDDLKMLFPNDHNGSRIMLTTRLSDVAAYPDPYSPLYEMHLMDANQSWNLLRQKVFPHQDCPPRLENIGKTIARSCRGLPLAIVVIAEVLSTVSMNPVSWGEISENVNSAVATKEGQFEKILSLSYTQLPHHLKPCFLYMACFPEDYEVRISKLIKLWVAEGFLKCPNGSKSLEEEAEECLEDLVKRSLVLVTKRKSNGKIKSCSLHDLLRDLCMRKAHEENFLVNFMARSVEKMLSIKRMKNHRRVSIASSGLAYHSTIYGSKIRTIMCFRCCSLDSLKRFRLLRVLDLGDAYVESLPAQLFELFYLKYLAMNFSYWIPEAILNLQNLQTLIIHARGGWRLMRLDGDCLPWEIWRMPQLRHLVFFGWLPDPQGINSTLENLQTLSLVSHLICTKEILKRTPNLKKLGIYCCPDGYSQDGYLHNLVYLDQLENLELRSLSANAVWRKDNFSFPRTLKKLTLNHLLLPWKDMTIVGSLPNLQVLKLRNSACHGGEWETTEGQFLKLEFLLIEESDLQRWITESSHFPSLKCLMLLFCSCLSEIPNGFGEIPTLELIKVENGNESLVESVKRMKEEQQNWGNDALQFRCMRWGRDIKWI